MVSPGSTGFYGPDKRAGSWTNPPWPAQPARASTTTSGSNFAKKEDGRSFFSGKKGRPTTSFCRKACMMPTGYHTWITRLTNSMRTISSRAAIFAGGSGPMPAGAATWDTDIQTTSLFMPALQPGRLKKQED